MSDTVVYWQPIDAGSPAHSSCGNCPPRAGRLLYTDDPSPGFGIVRLVRDGVTLAERYGPAAEAIRRWRGEARRDSNHEWAIEIEGPMSGVRYTRQSNGQWLATHKCMGFA